MRSASTILTSKLVSMGRFRLGSRERQSMEKFVSRGDQVEGYVAYIEERGTYHMSQVKGGTGLPSPD